MISFTIEGFMGHFRKYYTTVTPLSYVFPPRNTIVGILAAILGLKRDSYYNLFLRSNSKIGLQILTPVRKVSFSTNYLDIDALSYEKFRGKGMVPTRGEYVISLDGGALKYKIFLEHKDENLLETLEAKLKEMKSYYPLSLGSANCLAFLSDYQAMKDIVPFQTNGEEEFEIITIVRQDQIKIDPAKNVGRRIMIEERLPPDFKDDRIPGSKSLNYVYEADCKPLIVALKGEVYRIDDKYGAFM